MKLLSHENLGVVFDTGDGDLSNYKLEIAIPAEYSKAKRRATIKVMKQNASFKGFRKGTIPPFIMKDIPGFVLRDCLEELLSEALNDLKLTPPDGKELDPQLDVNEMLTRFQVGEEFSFTCEMVLQSLAEEALAADVDDLDEVIDIAAEDQGITTDEALAGLNAETAKQTDNAQ